MLQAACFTLNVRPCQGGLGPTASRSWLWYTRPPSMSTLLAVPGSMVRTQVSPIQFTHALYIRPNDDMMGHIVFCLESRVLISVTQVMADVDPFLQTLSRTSSLTSDLFWPERQDTLIREAIGAPSIFGDDVGLATPAWLATLVPQALPPPPLLTAEDLPDLVDAVSDDEVEILPPTAADLTPSTDACVNSPLNCQVTPAPIVVNPGARLHFDTGAQMNLSGMDSGPAGGFQDGAHGVLPSAV